MEIGRERREGWGKDEDGRGRNGGWDGDERERGRRKGGWGKRREGRKEGRERDDSPDRDSMEREREREREESLQLSGSRNNSLDWMDTDPQSGIDPITVGILFLPRETGMQHAYAGNQSWYV